MKIVHANDVVYGYASGDPSANGGAERYEWLLARALARAGWCVTVGVRKTLKAGERRAIDGVEFVGIGDGQVLVAWHRFLVSERPDWWFWQCADHWLGPAFAVARAAGVRTIFSAMHDRDVRPRQALFRRSRWWPLYAWGLRWSDRIFVQHREQLSQLPSHCRSKASVLPGIVDKVTEVKPHADREKYVAWVGVLRQPKRADLLVEIARRAPEIRFVVCGGPTSFMCPPGYGERIVDALRSVPNIEYLGHVAPDKTLLIIKDAALLLSTSDEEGFPSVFLEAWASGTPVVSLKIDPDRVIERVGLGAVSGDVDGAITDIRDLMVSPTLRQEIAKRARRHVSETHSELAVSSLFDRSIRQGGRD